MNLYKKIGSFVQNIVEINRRLKYLQEACGRIELRQLADSNHPDIHRNEFRVYSQWGEDGIIQYLLRHVDIKKKIFIEFGVENYSESNTRFLLTNNNWSGLVIDGSQKHIDYIKNDKIYWQYNLKAEREFITKDNINEIFNRCGISGDIGILSVDIDGNDYWVWEAINTVSAAIVITEYNARFGPDKAVTVPYDATFIRSKAHYSMIYYGASLNALTLLARKKGYALVGCNSAGNNAFFVKKDLLTSSLKEISVEEAYVANQFRESRDAEANLTFLSFDQEMALLDNLPFVDVSNDYT